MQYTLVGLLIFIFIQFGYIVYLDRENRKERERLQLKLIAKNTEEYTKAVAEIETPPPKVDEEKPKDDEVEFRDLEDVESSVLLSAKDHL